MEEIINDIAILLKQHGIDIEKYKFLKGKRYFEVLCKINFLKSKGIPIEKEEKLNEIFWIKDSRLEKRCGISSNELYENYKEPKILK